MVRLRRSRVDRNRCAAAARIAALRETARLLESELQGRMRLTLTDMASGRSTSDFRNWRPDDPEVA